MTNRRRVGRNRRGYTPLQLAILTGAPLPADVEGIPLFHWTAAETERPVTIMSMLTIHDLWRDYHGREMTAAEKKAVKARLREGTRMIEARRAAGGAG